jgi:hypothetical protein
VNRLFVEFYLDEDVDVLVAELLRSRGFLARTTLEAGRLGSTDEQQLAFAAGEEMAVLTHNRAEFEELAEHYFVAGRTHWGIVISVRRSPYEIASRLFGILNSITADEMRNQLIYI